MEKFRFKLAIDTVLILNVLEMMRVIFRLLIFRLCLSISASQFSVLFLPGCLFNVVRLAFLGNTLLVLIFARINFRARRKNIFCAY